MNNVRTTLATALDNNHWKEEKFKQKMSFQDWQNIQLSGKDLVIYKGIERKLIAKKISNDLVEVYKDPF